MPATRTWQAIRGLRATRPGHVADDPERSAVFSAALEQAEQLAAATAAAGYAAKPLPLFYSLSQAGRAITAVRLQDHWKPSGHGLKVLDLDRGPLMTRVRVDRGSGTSFAAVTCAINSQPLVGTASIAALWAANPDLSDLARGQLDANIPVALTIPLGGRNTPTGTHSQSDPTEQVTTTGGFVTIQLEIVGATAQEVKDALQHYPTLSGGQPFGEVPGGSGPVGDDTEVMRHAGSDGRPLVTVGFPCPAETTLADYYRRQDDLCSTIQHSAVWPHAIYGYALPRIGDGPAPKPLMLWWTLLLALSSLARYEPAKWTEALDVDSSPLAVALERLLDIAEQEVPKRVFDELTV